MLYIHISLNSKMAASSFLVNNQPLFVGLTLLGVLYLAHGRYRDMGGKPLLGFTPGSSLASLAQKRTDLGWQEGLGSHEAPVFWNGGDYADVNNQMQANKGSEREGMRQRPAYVVSGMVGDGSFRGSNLNPY
jgi:hypothetical protein